MARTSPTLPGLSYSVTRSAGQGRTRGTYARWPPQCPKGRFAAMTPKNSHAGQLLVNGSRVLRSDGRGAGDERPHPALTLAAPPSAPPSASSNFRLVSPSCAYWSPCSASPETLGQARCVSIAAARRKRRADFATRHIRRTGTVSYCRRIKHRRGRAASRCRGRISFFRGTPPTV